MKRDNNLDGLKFIMIFLVVLGHLNFDDYGLELKNYIYSFHMPVFVFLSGYFTSLKNDKKKQIKWLKKIALIYIFAQLGHVVLDCGIHYISCSINKEPFSIRPCLSFVDIYCPRFALWYLLSLIYWRLATWHIFNKCSDVTLLVVSILLSIASGFIPIGHAFSFQRSFSFLPFFVLGLIFKKRDLMSKLERVPIWVPFIIIAICFIISKDLPLFQPREYYNDFHDTILRIEQSVIGLCLSLSIINISRNIKCIEKVAKYGVYTLWIYVGHTFLVVFGKEIFPQIGISFNIWIAILLALLYCSLFIFLARTYKSFKMK